MLEKKPEIGNEVEVVVKGYGCDDDCYEYFAKKSASIDHCGWKKSAKDSDFW